MDDYAGRVLADRYRLPLVAPDEHEAAYLRAFDTYSGQEVLVRQVPLPEIVEAEVLGADGLPEGFALDDSARATAARAADPAVRRAIEAAQAAAQVPDHPRLDQVFDVFAEGGSLWIVSELVPARPLSALLAEEPLSPYRAAEVAADVLTGLRALHAHGWVHRNITARTVMICEDGRVMLTGLAVGAAEEALCGYDPRPDDGPGAGTPDTPRGHVGDGGGFGGAPAGGRATVAGPWNGATGPEPGTASDPYGRPPGSATGGTSTGGGRTWAEATGATRPLPAVGGTDAPGAPDGPDLGPRLSDGSSDARAARAGAIAAYRAGTRAAARVGDEQRDDEQRGDEQRGDEQRGDEQFRDELFGTEPDGWTPDHSGTRNHSGAPDHYGTPDQYGDPDAPGVGYQPQHGRITDPYGVQRDPGHQPQGDPWHGARPRGTGAPELPPAEPRAPAPDEARTRPLPEFRTSFRDQTGHGTAGITGPGRVPVQPTPAAAPGTTPERAPAPRAAAPEPRQDGWGARPAAPRRGPATALTAERARQARMAVVGPVTERWAPEQAGPVHDNWQLAAPIGPATDLWALGALLFRAVQGHAPYPEDSTAELVQLVCAEPPAFAEECGPLRPVVESLLRQDPTERPDFEELRGWLRSLVRSAPEPDAGTFVIAAPPPDPRRLPVVRRRGELLRRRRKRPASASSHRRRKPAPAKPRNLGRTLLVVVMLGLAGAVAYAMVFMPQSGTGTNTADKQRTSSVGGDGGDAPRATPGTDGRPVNSPSPDGKETGTPDATRKPAESPGAGGPAAPEGFTTAKDAEGFSVAVADGWDRQPKNASGQIVYSGGSFQLLVVPGRDSTGEFGADPLIYMRESQRELTPFRDSTWSQSSGMRRVEVGGQVSGEGQFTWTDTGGGELYVRNYAAIIDGRYHIVQLRGPEAERDEVTRLYEQAKASYRATG
ncbi:protein kinase [Streptomyces uncialis]|uniref:protein kinase domain-containing protein n=1 Tax=Streptomyces uncialis TaxID=1048205 RepID=UPI0037A30935